MQEKCGFRIGDRVVLTVERDPDDGVCRGATGTVCDITSMKNKLNIGVRWDQKEERYHDCNRTCEMGYGWFVPYDCITHQVSDIGEFSQSDQSIAALFE